MSLTTQPASCFFELFVKVRTRDSDRRHQAEQNSCNHRDSGHDQQHGLIDSNLLDARQHVRQYPKSCFRSPESDETSKNSRHHSEQDTFDQELADDTAPASAERSTNNHLARALCRTGQQYISNVHTRDQEHTRYCSHQNHQQWLNIAYNVLLQWNQFDSFSLVRIRILVCEMLSKNSHVSLRLLETDS